MDINQLIKIAEGVKDDSWIFTWSQSKYAKSTTYIGTFSPTLILNILNDYEIMKEALNTVALSSGGIVRKIYTQQTESADGRRNLGPILKYKDVAVHELAKEALEKIK